MTQREADVEAIAALAPGARIVPLDVAVDPTNPEVAGGQRLLNNAVLGRPIDENTIRDSGVVFVATPELLDYLSLDADDQPPGTLVLTRQTGDVYITGNITQPTFIRNPVPADQVVHIDVPNVSSGPRTLMTDAGLDAAGLEPMRAGWLLDLEEPLTADDLARARELAADAGLAVEARDTTGGLTIVRHVATAAGVLLALSILAMTAGLLRGESRHELRTLHAVGATGRIRRAITASTCGVLALAGAALAVVISYAALLAGYWPETDRLADVPVAPPGDAHRRASPPGRGASRGCSAAGSDPTSERGDQSRPVLSGAPAVRASGWASSDCTAFLSCGTSVAAGIARLHPVLSSPEQHGDRTGGEAEVGRDCLGGGHRVPADGARRQLGLVGPGRQPQGAPWLGHHRGRRSRRAVGRGSRRVVGAVRLHGRCPFAQRLQGPRLGSLRGAAP